MLGPAEGQHAGDAVGGAAAAPAAPGRALGAVAGREAEVVGAPRVLGDVVDDDRLAVVEDRAGQRSRRRRERRRGPGRRVDAGHDLGSAARPSVVPQQHGCRCRRPRPPGPGRRPPAAPSRGSTSPSSSRGDLGGGLQPPLAAARPPRRAGRSRSTTPAAAASATTISSSSLGEVAAACFSVR